MGRSGSRFAGLCRVCGHRVISREPLSVRFETARAVATAGILQGLLRQAIWAEGIRLRRRCCHDACLVSQSSSSKRLERSRQLCTQLVNSQSNLKEIITVLCQSLLSVVLISSSRRVTSESTDEAHRSIELSYRNRDGGYYGPAQAVCTTGSLAPHWPPSLLVDSGSTESPLPPE
jgi:hypothetical protein